MQIIKTIIFTAAVALCVETTAAGRHNIWFDKPTPDGLGEKAWLVNDFSATIKNPDSNWESASIPVGNGSVGATVLGAVGRERIVLNEKSLWTGGPGAGCAGYWGMNREVSPDTLAHIRSLLAAGRNKEAADVVSEHFRGTVPYTRDIFGTFTMLGEAYINTGLDQNAVSNYRRELDIDNATASVSFNIGRDSYRREFFCSYPDSVLVMRFTASVPQTLGFSFDTPQVIDDVDVNGSTLLYTGHLDNNNMQWAMAVGVRVPEGGEIRILPFKRCIEVKDASTVEFIIGADTDYGMEFDPDFTDPRAYVKVDPAKLAVANVENALKQEYGKLLENHLADYHNLYNRVSLNINPGNGITLLPTAKRLERYRNGSADFQLEETYYQYGRYLLIASSRPGNMPANLQGVWNNNSDGPWRVDYHNNINLQMNYWPAISTALNECFVPFVDYIRSLEKSGGVTAKAYYGAPGWTAEVSTNIFGFTAPLDSRDMSWNYNPTAGAWLATQLWEYYDYTRDRQWLAETGYPLIAGSADFVAHLLVEDGDCLTSSPSYSPEHGTCDQGATYANAVTREILQQAVMASDILGVDSARRAVWQDKLNRIAPYKIGRMGQLCEWYEDIDLEGDKHRHTNHLFGLHPGTTIDPLTTPELADACRETLRQRGDAATGWSMGWKLNHWARLHDGNHAYVLLGNLLKNGTADNLWDLHPPFQIDGNFGGTAGMTELLLQSHMGEINLLPALPDAWQSGNAKGLQARGNFVVDIHFANGALTRAVIVSRSGEKCNLRYHDSTLSFDTTPGGVYIVTLNNGSLQLI